MGAGVRWQAAASWLLPPLNLGRFPGHAYPGLTPDRSGPAPARAPSPLQPLYPLPLLAPSLWLTSPWVKHYESWRALYPLRRLLYNRGGRLREALPKKEQVIHGD